MDDTGTFAGGTMNITRQTWMTNDFVATGFTNGVPESGKPTGTHVFVRPNLYEPGRANITAFNWDTNDFVEADISAIGLAVGEQFELHQVNDYFGDVRIGSYSGNKLSICMTNHSVATPIGQYSQPTTFPTFGAFVIRKHKIP